MKKLLSLVIAVGLIAGIAYATNAFFSDEEKSVGNTFAAGELDLRFQVEGAPAVWADVNGNPLFDGVTFPLGDLKPGDKGEKTVRLWVDDNPSCGKVSVDITEDKDNTCTEPEGIDEGGVTIPACAEPGELNDQVNFAVWSDPNCNNVLDPEVVGYCKTLPGAAFNCSLGVNGAPVGQELCDQMHGDNLGCEWVPATPAETILTAGTVTEDKAYSIGELPVGVAAAQCYGVAYCFGTWEPDGSCDGSLLNNTAQSDSFKADVIINALQKRNQFPNGCPATGDWLEI